MIDYKIVIIGAGVVGLSIAKELSKKTDKIIVIEKEKSFGQHTSSRNSQVIHSGVYYPPNSKKALHCINGNKLLYKFCENHNIDYQKTGKIIIAQDDTELQKILQLKENGEKNNLKNLQIYNREDLLKIEPNLKAKYGLFVPSTGIFDSHQFMAKLEYLSQNNGVDFLYNYEIKGIKNKNNLIKINFTNKESITCNYLINAAGLWSENVANMAGVEKYQLEYYKGDYYSSSKHRNYFKHLIYPLPTDLSLGIHAVLDLNGNVGFGPNAYKVKNIDYSNSDLYKKDFYDDISRYVDIDLEDLKIDFSGIRPKIKTNKNTYKDFIIDYSLKNIVNLIAIESPGLTSALSIAKDIKAKMKNI